MAEGRWWDARGDVEGGAGEGASGRRPAPARAGRRRGGVLAVACAASVAALALVALAPRAERAELVSAPFVLGGGGAGSVLQQLSYDHAAERGVARGVRGVARGVRGRVRARNAGRAQQLDELNPDDPAYGTYKWRDPATLEQEENAFDDEDEYPTAPHEWKGAGEPEENVMDYEGSTEWPDEPSEGTYAWRDPATLEQEENTFDDEDEYPTAPHEWKGAGEPEENVFENAGEEDGALKTQGGRKQAALARVHEKASRQVAQRADAAEQQNLEQAAHEQVQREKRQLDQAAQQKAQLEHRLVKRDKQLASVTKQLLAEKQRVAQVEKEAQGHIWRRQHSPVNVLKTVYPQINWKWHKNVEHLPSAIFDNLKAKPVLWHKYRPTPSHVLDYLSTAPVEWHAQKQSYNALEELPAGARYARAHSRRGAQRALCVGVIMHTCACICMCVYVYTFLHVLDEHRVFVHVCMQTYVCTYIFTRGCTCVQTSIDGTSNPRRLTSSTPSLMKTTSGAGNLLLHFFFCCVSVVLALLW